MKRLIPVLLAGLLLCGCAVSESQNPAPVPETTVPPTTETAPAVPVGFYDPNSTLEALTDGALQVYPLYRPDAAQIVTMGDGVLLFSGDPNTTLTLLAGDDLYVKASANLNCHIQASDPAVQVSDKGVTYYDEATNELVFLDAMLREGTRFPMPADMVGTPALSANRKNLYYCTENALRTIELDSGLNVLLRELAGETHKISELHCADMVITCQVTDNYGNESTLYLSTENGRTLWETADSVELATKGSRYFALHRDGLYPEFLTGTINDAISLLNYNGFNTRVHPVLDLDGALLFTENSQGQTFMEFCNLATGNRTSLLECSADLEPLWITADARGDSLLMLCYDDSYECHVIYRWNLSRSTVADDRNYLVNRYTAQNPDLEALAQCTALADQLGQRHGVQIKLWTDAAEGFAQLNAEPEYQAKAIRQWLDDLDQILSVYPAGFLSQLAGPTGQPLQICLVRSYEPTADDEDLSCLLYRDANADPYLLVASHENWKTDFKHQLFHVIEAHVLTTCSAYDSWNSLNPKSFRYTLDYNAASGDALQPFLEDGSFIDLYATSFPKEDRAMTMLAALEPGMEACFQSRVMQSKLKLLCSGIRIAFGYKKSPEVFLWEQYLK